MPQSNRNAIRQRRSPARLKRVTLTFGDGREINVRATEANIVNLQDHSVQFGHTGGITDNTLIKVTVNP